MNKLSVGEIKKIICNEFNTRVLSLDNKSKGWDHKVFIANTEKGKFVIRIPIKDKNKLKLQAWVCKRWKSIGVSVPEPLVIKKDFLIETCIEGKDIEDAKLTKKQTYDFFLELGKQLKKMHSVKTNSFGYFKKEMRGKYKTWHSFIGNDFLKNIKFCLKKKRISKIMANKLMQYYEDNKVYLEKFNNPKLLHTNLRKCNLMVKDGKFSGIIDVSDAFSGDPLYDIGGIFYEFEDGKVIDMIEKYYGKVNRKMVKYYAFSRVWLLSILNRKEAKKVKSKINKLINTKI